MMKTMMMTTTLMTMTMQDNADKDNDDKDNSAKHNDDDSDDVVDDKMDLDSNSHPSAAALGTWGNHPLKKTVFCEKKIIKC